MKVVFKAYNVKWNDDYDVYAWHVLGDWNVYLDDVMPKWSICSCESC